MRLGRAEASASSFISKNPVASWDRLQGMSAAQAPMDRPAIREGSVIGTNVQPLGGAEVPLGALVGEQPPRPRRLVRVQAKRSCSMWTPNVRANPAPRRQARCKAWYEMMHHLARTTALTVLAVAGRGLSEVRPRLGYLPLRSVVEKMRVVLRESAKANSIAQALPRRNLVPRCPV